MEVFLKHSYEFPNTPSTEGGAGDSQRGRVSRAEMKSAQRTATQQTPLPAPSCASLALAVHLGTAASAHTPTPTGRRGSPGEVAATGRPRAEEGLPALKLTSVAGQQRASLSAGPPERAASAANRPQTMGSLEAARKATPAWPQAPTPRQDLQSSPRGAGCGSLSAGPHRSQIPKGPPTSDRKQRFHFSNCSSGVGHRWAACAG